MGTDYTDKMRRANPDVSPVLIGNPSLRLALRNDWLDIFHADFPCLFVFKYDDASILV
jgi:hypothetical protein